ncbi:MAG TPA: hypothetical protein VM012_05595 [Flavitalea sp.]|nr:hypothetical protein [Flavitalea sp.]
MIDVLNSYLVQYNKISIPGLGTIQLERIPAQSDFINKQILPPAYKYRFDKYFDVPDKEFFTYLAVQKQIPDYEAINVYNEWAQHLRNTITPTRQVVWNHVGTLRRDLNGEVIFESAGPVDANYEPVNAIRVIHSNAEHTMIVGDREISTREMSELLGEEAPVEVEKESWWLYALIIIALSLIVIFFHFYKNGLTPGSFGNQQKIHLPA